MTRTIRLILLLLLYNPASTTFMQLWTQIYENLNDYQLLLVKIATSPLHCTTLAARLIDVQLVTHNSSTGVCSVFRCRLSLQDCRMCRNIDSRNQLVWVPSSNIGQCWITVQHRVSNSTNFYRNWSEYKTGFGEGPNGNFWIGLDSLNSLTSVRGGRKLRFLMKAWNFSESWAQYSSFSVGPETDGFRLSVSGFSSSHAAIGDSFASTNGTMFTTMDVDNDNCVLDMSLNCAVGVSGAWWFAQYGRCHLNGVYQFYPTAVNRSLGEGIIWGDGYGYYYSLMEIEMLII